MKTLNTSFNQIRINEELQAYSTYPNGIAVFERGTGIMRILSTDVPCEDSYMCYSIDGSSLKEFIHKCKKFDENAINQSGRLYTIDLWNVETENDTKLNEDLMMYFSRQPQLMFDEQNQ